MKINEAGLDLIRKAEGLVLHSYQDAVDVWTIGYGHTGSDVKPGMNITESQAEALLKKDVARFEEGVNKLVTVELNENQFSALVSFSYNLGLGNLKSSDLLELTNKKEFDKAAKEFDRWVYAKGRMLPGLVKRRDAEQALFMKKVPKVEIKKPTKKFLSLVDYLKANHKPADFISRRKLAESHGIKNYTGRAEENIKLLNILQK